MRKMEIHTHGIVNIYEGGKRVGWCLQGKCEDGRERVWVTRGYA